MTDPCWLLFQLLTVLNFSSMVVSSSPIPNLNTSISNQIKVDNCFSPSKNILDHKNVAELCDIHESGLDDSRDILCQGLFDLHTTFCKQSASSISSFKHLEFSEFGENSSVDDFCKEWTILAKSEQTSELFKHDSFKKITESCNFICSTLGKKKLNSMCPLLLRGSRSFRVSTLPESQKDTHVVMEPSPNQNPRMLVPSPRVEPAVDNPEINLDDNPPGGGVTSAVLETVNNAHSPGNEIVNAIGKPDKEVLGNPNSPPLNPDVVPNLDENKELSDSNGNIDGSDKNSEPLPVQPAISPPVKSQTSTSNNAVNDLENPNNVLLQEKQSDVGEDVGEANKENEEGMSKINMETPEVKNEPSKLTKNNNQPVKPKITNNLAESSQTAPKVNNDLGDENDYNPMTDFINDQNMVAEQQSSQREPMPAKDLWVEAEDPHFFQYFMIISAAFILGYVALVNKKKIIALLVEGRREGGRRRHQSASYSKLSNLEEALSSNRSTVSSHQVLY